MIDLVLVLLFVVYAVTAGLRARRRASRGLREYFLAGRSIAGWRSGLSMTATQFAADTPLLAAGLVATGGVFALWRLWIYGIAFLLLGLLLGRAWWRAGVVTDAEFCELRYSGQSAAALRGVKAVYYGLIFNCAVLAMVLAAAIRIAEPFLVWDQWLPAPVFGPLEAVVRTVGVPLAMDAQAPDVWARSASNLFSIGLILLFTTTYSMTGGLRGVVATDIMQLAIAFAGTAAYAWYAVDAVGGHTGMRDALTETVGRLRAAQLLAFDPSMALEVSASLLAVIGLQWLFQMYSDGTGYLAQRTMACRTEADAEYAPVVFAFVQIVGRTLLWLPIFVALLVLFPLEDAPEAARREAAFVHGIEALLPPGVRGLMLVGLLAALASTLDTHLNWGASYLANDLYARLICPLFRRRPTPRHLVWVARFCNPALVLVSLFLMAHLSSIQAAWKLTLLLGAGLGGPLLLRWFWSRINAWGELSAIIGSALSAAILLLTVEEEAIRLLVVAVVGIAACVAGSLATPAVAAARLREFYERVRPPGFWGTAEARLRFRTGLIRVLAATGSLFTSLVGLGTLIIQGTPPSFLPHRGLWVTVNLLAALAFVPVWWRNPVRRTEEGSRRACQH